MTDTPYVTNETRKERAVLCGLAAACFAPGESSTDVSMAELAALVETAGGEPVAFLVQNRAAPDPRSFIGEGKEEELRGLIEANEADLVVFDNELSPSQMRVLSEDLKVKVMDRSGLILDIFAQRARTREGQLQVELAQYKYLLPRQEGAIGTRGPGETQLESDRRHIRRKIQKLESELAEVRKNRATQRRRREKNEMPTVALVGSTNAGKSTLLNRLTGSDIPANNRLFDTLDTTTRRMMLDEAEEILLSDTVGFIRKLPTHLIEAFKATLEELQYADLLLHVIDMSSEEWRSQAEIVDALIAQLGAEGTPCIRVYNKCDVCPDLLPQERDAVCISARTGEGVDRLLKMIAEKLGRGRRRAVFLIPYDKGALVQLLHDEAAVRSLEYVENGTRIEAVVKPELWPRVEAYAEEIRE